MTAYPTADLHPHRDADLVPWADPESHEALMADIEAHGIQVPLDALPDGTVLDGRTRLAIARVLGITEVPVRWVEPADPVAYMIRMALLRRHLTTADRKALAASLIKADPQRSDRSVAKTTGIDHKTVAVVREEAERRGELPHVATRTDTLGRQQPATRPTVVPQRDLMADPEVAREVYAGLTEAAAGETPPDDTAAFASRDRALTPQMREAEATASASAEWHRAWSAVLRITGGLDPETVAAVARLRAVG